jgi:hypothetical protein
METSMVLEEELLQKARAAGHDLTEAERRVQMSRAEYHTVIRRLHLAGGSLREIAQALSISHQRVQQIVEAAGGSWWQHVWRTRRPAPDTVCTFCDRPPSEVEKLMAGPDVFICDACVAAAEKTLGGLPTNGWAGGRPRMRCSFCSKPQGAERRLGTHRAGNVCGECLATCRQIMDGRAGARPAP